ncbi:MAG: ATP-binding protein [Clostridia bacterium]|nr:ATP-binding protein [Clostridia bacterium]
MEIKRDIYLTRLRNRRKNGMIKVITGIRRCGKSYLLNTIFYNDLISTGISPDHIIRFAFDSADDLRKIRESPARKPGQKVNADRFMDYIDSLIPDGDDCYLLLDEVQLLECFESVLNGYLRRSNLDIYVTGSNSKFLSSDIITEFAGRGDEIHMLPLSFSEFFSVYSGTKEESFDDYSVYGGLPAVALMAAEEQKSSYLNTQIKNVYLRDVIARNRLTDDGDIEELTEILASGISTLINPNKLSNTFRTVKRSGISPSTVSRYIRCLEDAFIVSTAQRYDVKGKRYISTPYKVYFEDIGLRNALLNFRQIEPSHIMENIIYNELRYRGYNVDVGSVEARERDTDNREVKKLLEIDFIANQGSKRYYLQSAYDIPDSAKYVQETNSYSHVKDSFKKILIIGQSMKPRHDENGYLTLGIREFLLDPDSLEA